MIGAYRWKTRSGCSGNLPARATRMTHTGTSVVAICSCRAWRTRSPLPRPWTEPGLDLIAYYVLTPSLSDLDYFKALDAAGFRPQRLGLICNAGAVNGDRSPAKAFEPLLSDPFVVALMEHGAIPLFMPALAADAFEAVRQSGAKTFRDALAKMDDFMHETRLGDWLDVAMEEGIGKRLDALGWFV
jgi:hypothetical protein